MTVLLMQFTGGNEITFKRYATRGVAEKVGIAIDRSKGLIYTIERPDDLLGLALNAMGHTTISLSALVKLHNLYANEPVEKFGNRTIAAARVQRLLCEKFADLPLSN